MGPALYRVICIGKADKEFPIFIVERAIFDYSSDVVHAYTTQILGVLLQLPGTDLEGIARYTGNDCISEFLDAKQMIFCVDFIKENTSFEVIVKQTSIEEIIELDRGVNVSNIQGFKAGDTTGFSTEETDVDADEIEKIRQSLDEK